MKNPKAARLSDLVSEMVKRYIKKSRLQGTEINRSASADS